MMLLKKLRFEFKSLNQGIYIYINIHLHINFR